MMRLPICSNRPDRRVRFFNPFDAVDFLRRKRKTRTKTWLRPLALPRCEFARTVFAQRTKVE